MGVFERAVLVCVAAVFPAPAQSPAFEVVSVKQNLSQDFRRMNVEMLPGGRFTATNLALRWLLSLAYNVPVNPTERLSGIPPWAQDERYDIEAKAPEGAVPVGLPDSEFRARMRIMLQGLLANRFKAKVRKDTKEITVYAIMVGKDGPKMKQSEIDEKGCAAVTDRPGCHDFNGGMGRGLHAKAVSMDDLAGYVENWTDHPVINRTGLDGLYAMETEGWAPMRLPPPPTGNVPNPAARPSGDGDMTDPARPTLFNIMQKLGLELRQQKGPVDFYIIERLERPEVN
ncbi:MAG TPA: TIGR03435 family protein [Bryobacteraceae bacterium]|nr:TIGR03435 family protein [Bryobacteraceae bacterium]